MLHTRRAEEPGELIITGSQDQTKDKVVDVFSQVEDQFSNTNAFHPDLQNKPKQQGEREKKAALSGSDKQSSSETENLSVSKDEVDEILVEMMEEREEGYVRDGFAALLSLKEATSDDKLLQHLQYISECCGLELHIRDSSYHCSEERKSLSNGYLG